MGVTGQKNMCAHHHTGAGENEQLIVMSWVPENLHGFGGRHTFG